MTRNSVGEDADNMSMRSQEEPTANLATPVDDGGAAHLVGRPMPTLALPSTGSDFVRIDSIGKKVVFFIFPMIGRPGRSLPAGWDEIPGARGCTPEACAFRSLWHRFQCNEVQVVGMSTQQMPDLRDASVRLDLPFELLSDDRGHARRELGLPTFGIASNIYLKRLTLVVVDGVIDHVFYPVFPVATHPYEVLDFVQRRESPVRH